MKEDQKYMNVETGSAESRDGWWYENSSGEQLNAVDLGEVLLVFWDKQEECWTEVG